MGKYMFDLFMVYLQNVSNG